METYIDQFSNSAALITGSFRTTQLLDNPDVRDAYDDFYNHLGLDFASSALLVWMLEHLDGEMVTLEEVSSQIAFEENAVSSSLTELEKRSYIEPSVLSEFNLDITSRTKERIYNHYCFSKLLDIK